MCVCPLCGSEARAVFSAKVLGDREASYGLCQNCGLLFADQPNWLDEAYRHPIAQIDTGVMRRNLLNALRVTGILTLLFPRGARYLDFAGGYGVFTRLMRDIGFDFYWQDKYCANLLAQGFEGEPGQEYALVTAMEVLEHVPSPTAFVTSIIEETGCDSLLFSTTLFEGEPPSPDWHYYAFESGQHISFYQRRTLDLLASRVGMHYVHGGDLHLFTKKAVSPFLFRLLASRWGVLAFPFARALLRSRTQRDFEALRQQLTMATMPASDTEMR